jgi:CubicO group peptidase (beta-lactamase class C family)
VTETPQRDAWPTVDWQMTAPEAVGLDPSHLEALDAYARDSMPPIRGILIVRHGRIAFERYYDGCTPETFHSINSVTKSVLSALIGIALRKGLLTSVDQPLTDFFPELVAVQDDPQKQTLTLRHLLTMTSGFAAPGPGTPLMSRLPLDSLDIVEAAFARPLAAPPGEVFRYDDLSCHLLSIVLTRLSGQSTAEFAELELFEPLGIWASGRERFVWQSDRGLRDAFHQFGYWPDDGRPWKVDQHGDSLGPLGLHLTLREMAKFGYLSLNCGRWDGQEIVPAWFVEESTRAQSAGGPPTITPYGYLWWIGRGDSFFASGFGGQSIGILPSRDTVVAVSTALPRNGPGEIFRRFIIPALAD